MQSPKRPGSLLSVRFSPAEPTVIAVATWGDKAVLYDIRNFKRFVTLCFVMISLKIYLISILISDILNLLF